MEKKYNDILTVILVISIIAIVILAGFWIYDIYTKNKVEKDALAAIEEFNKQIGLQEESNIIENEIPEPEQEPEIEPEENSNNNTSSTSSNSGQKYNDFTILGQIEIPKTKVSYPVLEEMSPKALNVAVSKLYGPGLNQVGNTVIIGHNNRNGLFFSNNKKLSIGDKIYITDLNGNKITYIIYNKYETTDTDTDYMTRDTNGAREISLSTCTDDGKLRIIIWAKEQ